MYHHACIMYECCVLNNCFLCFKFDDSSSGFLSCEFSSERPTAETVGINGLPWGAIATATLHTGNSLYCWNMTGAGLLSFLELLLHLFFLLLLQSCENYEYLIDHSKIANSSQTGNYVVRKEQSKVTLMTMVKTRIKEKQSIHLLHLLLGRPDWNIITILLLRFRIRTRFIFNVNVHHINDIIILLGLGRGRFWFG